MRERGKDGGRKGREKVVKSALRKNPTNYKKQLK